MRHKTKILKKAFLVFAAAMLLVLSGCSNSALSGTGGGSASFAKPEAAADRYDGLPRLENAVISGYYALYEGDDRLEKDIVCIGNRPYIFADYSKDLKELGFPLYEDESGVYMALSDFVAVNDACAEFFPEDESVHYYHKEPYPWAEEAAAYMAAADANPDIKPAYIRLEDITADFGISGRFTNNNLMKTRVLVDYLADHSRAFYIAWIPIYVNPGEGIRNNIAEDFCFYNADFVFTLDYMQLRGGRLGLHGLTHQSGKSISGDGVEFGKYEKDGKEELFAIFDKAAGICESLGYKYYFFEFPHYIATRYEKDTAEEYFDIVYEYYMSKKEGVIERHKVGDRECLWVPTPADYVYHPHDLDGILSRLEISRKNGMILSLFMHPSMDSERISCMTEGNVRKFGYYEPTGILHGLFEYMKDHSYIFDEIK